MTIYRFDPFWKIIGVHWANAAKYFLTGGHPNVGGFGDGTQTLSGVSGDLDPSGEIHLLIQDTTDAHRIFELQTMTLTNRTDSGGPDYLLGMTFKAVFTDGRTPVDADYEIAALLNTSGLTLTFAGWGGSAGPSLALGGSEATFVDSGSPLHHATSFFLGSGNPHDNFVEAQIYEITYAGSESGP